MTAVSGRRGIKTFLLLSSIIIPVALGLAVRLIGLRHGEPDLIYHPDMAKQILVARSAYLGNPDPRVIYGAEDIRRSMYPYGTAVITAGLTRLYAVVSGADPEASGQFQWALRMRYLAVFVVLCSAAGVLLFMFYQTGPMAALLTGTLLCLEPVNAQFSHYGMNDVPLFSLLALSWVASGLMGREKASLPVFSLLSGLCAGIAFGIKYQGVLGLLFAGIAGLILLRRKGWKWAAPAALAVLGGFSCGALLTCPLLRSAPAYFFGAFPKFMSWQANILDRTIPLAGKLPRNTAAVAHLLWPSGHWLLVAGAAAAVVSAFSNRHVTEKNIPVFSASAFCALTLITVIGARDIIRANDLISLLGFLVLLSGYAIARAGQTRGKRRALSRRVFVVLPAVLAGAFFAISLLDARALARPDTQLLAAEWCRKHIPARSTVVRERYTMSPGRRDIEEYAVRYVCEAAVRGHIEAGRVDYVITSSLARDRFFDPYSPYCDKENQSVYNGITNRYESAAVFADRPLFYNQPRITVFRKRRSE